jgi:toxin-antitoxin system PIN domain toxin
VILPDVNLLVYAARADATEHDRFRAWLETTLASDEPFGIASIVLSGFIRVVTHPRIFVAPSSTETALAFATAIRNAPNAVPIEPGPRHWDLYSRLCRDVGAKGNLVADAYLAALAIDSGCEWITTDRDFARFPGLRWRHPFDSR